MAVEVATTGRPPPDGWPARAVEIGGAALDALGVPHAELSIVLCDDVALIGGLAIPERCLRIIRRNASTLCQHGAQAELGRGVTLACSFAIPSHRQSKVLGYALTLGVHVTEFILGCRKTRFSGRLHQPERGRVITLVVGGHCICEGIRKCGSLGDQTSKEDKR